MPRVFRDQALTPFTPQLLANTYGDLESALRVQLNGLLTNLVAKSEVGTGVAVIGDIGCDLVGVTIKVFHLVDGNDHRIASVRF